MSTTVQPILLLQGRDVRRYLHGRLTQDIKAMTIGQTRKSLMLTSQGRVQGKLEVLCAGANDFILISDNLSSPSAIAELIANILRFKVSDDVLLTELTGDALPEELRLIRGEPTIGKELTEKTMGTDIDVTAYVSFSKGCYTGQEPVEMSTARGRPNRTLLHFYVDGPEEISPGTEITPSGKITSCQFIPYLNRTFGLGFIKYDDREANDFYAGHAILCKIDNR